MTILTPEQQMIKETAREFAMREILPVANKLDPVQGDIPMELRDKIAELGFFGILFPEQYGGMGLGAMEHCLVAEEFSRGWMSVGSIVAQGNAMAVSMSLSQQLKDEYFPKMAKGEMIGCGSISEPGVGSDVANAAVQGREGWRQLGHHRQQILVHLRRRLRLHDPSGAHLAAGRPEEEASGPDRVLHQEEARPVAGWLHRRADPEDRLFRLEDVGIAFRRHPRAERSRRRRGRPRLLRNAARPGARPRSHRRALHRLRAWRLRGCADLCAGAQSVRSSDFGFPGDPLQARAYGLRDRSARVSCSIRCATRSTPASAPISNPRW